MSEQTLEQLYVEHRGKVSDKWNSYLIAYGRIFAEYRYKPVTLLEIGVQNGGSLEIWSRFFGNAEKFVGCDINPDCAQLQYEDPRITVVTGDANSDAVQRIVLQQSSVFDVIIDDGSHRSSDIVKSFARYFPHLADGGVFVAEDLHCSYWAEFEGGLFDPFSSITFFKRLVDVVNHEHWGVAKTRTDLLRGFFLEYDCQIDEDTLTHIHSIEFVNSICVIRKATPKYNSLGNRYIAGHDGIVEAVGVELISSASSTPSQIANAWTVRITPPDEDVLRLEKDVMCLENDVLRLEKDVMRLEEDLQQLEKEAALLIASRDMIFNSPSWQITKPLRFVGRYVKKVLQIFGI